MKGKDALINLRSYLLMGKALRLDDRCTTNACDPTTGVCGYQPIPDCCNVDGDCKNKDPCQEGTCTAGKCEYKPKVCDDKDVCTTDSCDPATGQCKFVPKKCNDGNKCTVDTCDKTTGQCKFAAVKCDDGNP
jgi:hypothetical protein